MSKRFALIAAVFLLLTQAVPVLACVAMPTQALAACCCEPDRACPMGQRADECVDADACCVQATSSTPALGSAATHVDERAIAPPSTTGAPPLADPLVLIGQQSSLIASHLSHRRTPPPSAVPLYLRHLRLTL